jgi:hypothetical protein
MTGPFHIERLTCDPKGTVRYSEGCPFRWAALFFISPTLALGSHLHRETHLIFRRFLWYTSFVKTSGRNSVVECQLPKLKVASSTLVARSTFITTI